MAAVGSAKPGESESSRAAGVTQPRRGLQLLVFLTLWGTYAYFWQSRDWNTAGRLMLTYALVDRGTLRLDGLEVHAADLRRKMGDVAWKDGHFYMQKAPGQSLVGVPAYAAWKWLSGYGGHPLYLPKASAYWVQDYWVTLFTSGLATALAGVLVYRFSVRVGSRHSDAVLLALAYALGTYAMVYATLFYGHQTASLCILAAFYLVSVGARSAEGVAPHSVAAGRARLVTAGLLAGWAGVTEMPLIPVAGLLGVEVWRRWRRPAALVVYGLSVLAAWTALFWYHWAAFGDPFTTGYHHLWDPVVRRVHESRSGLFGPNWAVLSELLWRVRRGLFVYAPVTVLGMVALGAMVWYRRWELCLVPAGTLAGLLLVNISHFYWAGGMSTGPRFLLPAVPLVVLPIAGWLGVLQAPPAPHTGGWGRRIVAARFLRALLVALGVAGTVIALVCAFAGGRFGPDNDPFSGDILPANPLTETVLPQLHHGELARTLGAELFTAAPWQQAAWLLCFLAAMFGLLVLCCRRVRQAPAGRFAKKTGKPRQAGVSPLERDFPAAW